MSCDTLAMSRRLQLANRLIQHLGLSPDQFIVQNVFARAAPVADVHAGYLRGRRYTDVGHSGFGLYKIVDDGCGSFRNRKIDTPA
jgi:hypothetical protein